MTNILNKNFDYIIYGGSIEGVATALFYASKNYDVLLVNKYGFLGGSITENLNLVQFYVNDSAPYFTKLIIDSLGKSDFTNIATTDYYYINPEKLKFVLQELLISNKVELLFHVTPVESVKENKLLLSGKEGLFTVSGNSVIDCSDNQFLQFLNGNINYTKGIYSFVVVGGSFEQIKYLINPDHIYKIRENSYIVSFFIKFDDVLTIENKTNELISKLTPVLLEKNFRVELLPVSAYLNFQSINRNKNKLETQLEFSEINKTDFRHIITKSIIAENNLENLDERNI